MNYSVLLSPCVKCGTKTTRQYARAHEGKCPACVNPKHGIELRFRKGRRPVLMSYAIYINGRCLVDHETTRADQRACGGIERRLEIEKKNNPGLPII